MAYREPAHWNPEAQGRRLGGEGRAALPDRAYAYVRTVDGKKVRKFPYMMVRDGKLVPSRKGCMSARNRAAQMISSRGMREYIPVFNKMTRILNSSFGYDLPTWAAHKKQRD